MHRMWRKNRQAFLFFFSYFLAPQSERKFVYPVLIRIGPDLGPVGIDRWGSGSNYGLKKAHTNSSAYDMGVWYSYALAFVLTGSCNGSLIRG